MIAALILGRGGSIGFPGKNTYPVLGRPLMEYAILAAQNTPEISEIYVSTDSKEIKEIGRKNDVYIIDRPAYLCTKNAKHQDAMVHGYQYIKALGKEIEQIVLLQCNAPFIMAQQLSEGINILRQHTEFDSAATVSEYSAFTPVRARFVDENRKIQNYMSQEMMKSRGGVARDTFKGKFILQTGLLLYVLSAWKRLIMDCFHIHGWGLPRMQ